MKEKRLGDRLQWIPLHQRLSRFGFLLSQKMDNRKPVYWITSVSTKQGSSILSMHWAAETNDQKGCNFLSSLLWSWG